MTKIKPLHFSIAAFSLLIFFTFVSLNTWAQTTTIFKGFVHDSITKQPLPFATVNIPTTGISAISNQLGIFTFHIPTPYKTQNAEISFVGYQRIQIELNSVTSDSLYSIPLVSKINKLNDVDVVGQKLMPAKEMVKLAIKKIPKNLPKTSTLLSGYYRDYIRNVKTDDYDNFTEAAVQIEDKGNYFNDYDYTKTKLEQLRFHPSFSIDSTLLKAYHPKSKVIPFVYYRQANELTILRGQDPVRNSINNDNSFLQLFDLNFLLDYSFQYNSCIDNEGAKIYEISFTAIPLFDSKVSGAFQINGKMYIENENYAILKFNYTVTCELANYSGKFMDVKIEYKKFKKDYYLNYHSACNYFEFHLQSAEDSVQAKQYFQYREFFVNKIEKKPLNRIGDNAISKGKSLHVNSVPETPGFWENYNYPRQVLLSD